MYYRYAIKKDSNTYYTIQGGQVTTQSTPKYFYEGINSFSDLGISEYRNMVMEGFYRNISQKGYQFVGELMKILRHVAFTYGVQGRATLVVERLSNYQSKTYILDYESDINFAKSSREQYQFVAELLQNGVEELLKSREDSPYTLAVSGDGLVTINILPFRVRGRAKFITIKAPGQSGHGPNRVAEAYNWPGYAYYNENVVEVLESPNYRPIDYFAPLAEGVSTVVEFGQFYNETGALGNPEGYLLKSNVQLEKVVMNFTLPIYVNNLDSSDVTFRGRIYKANAVSPANWTLIDSSVNTITVQASTDLSASFTFNSEFLLESGKVIHVIVENTTPSVTNVEWQYEAEKTLSIDFEHYTSQFTVTGLNWFEVGKRLVNNLTGGAATFSSDLLTRDVSYKDGIDCKPTCLALLSSKSIKGVSNPDIQISWANYLKATDVMLCSGSGVERAYDVNGEISSTKITLEKKSYYYKELKPGGSVNLIADLGDPAKEPEQSVTFADDLAYSEIHIGYRADDTDDLNGPDEYNTTLKMQTSYTKEKNTKDLVSPVSASGMAIYRKFIRYATGADNDNRNDNELFVLQYSPNVSSGVRNALYPGGINPNYNIQGVIDAARCLNIGLTPKRCLVRRGYWEYSHFYDSDPLTEAYKFNFLTLDKNKDLVSQVSGNYFIGEKTDEDLAVMLLKYGQQRLFFPYNITSNHEMPDNIRALWQGNRNGVFSVNVEGNSYLGFPFELHEKNAKPKLYDVKLRLTASQNPYSLR